MAKGEHLVGHAVDDIDPQDMTREAYGVDLGTCDRRSPGFRWPDGLFRRDRGLGLANLRQAQGQFADGAAGDVGLGTTAVVDDFPVR